MSSTKSQQLALARKIPSGTILPFAATAAPIGWLLCSGQSISRLDYQDLFDAIGTSHGSVDSDTFNVPDMRGRSATGKAYSSVTGFSSILCLDGVCGCYVGCGYGAESSAADAPSHNHTVASVNIAHKHTWSASCVAWVHQHTYIVDCDWRVGNHYFNQTEYFPNVAGSFKVTATLSGGDHQHTYVISPASPVHSHATLNSCYCGVASTGSAHKNIQPSIILYYIIKT